MEALPGFPLAGAEYPHMVHGMLSPQTWKAEAILPFFISATCRQTQSSVVPPPHPKK